MTKQRNEKTDKTEVVQKKWRKQRKAGKVQQVIEGGGVHVEICERPGRCQPSTLRIKDLSKHVYVYNIPVPGMVSMYMWHHGTRFAFGMLFT